MLPPGAAHSDSDSDVRKMSVFHASIAPSVSLADSNR